MSRNGSKTDKKLSKELQQTPSDQPRRKRKNKQTLAKTIQDHQVFTEADKSILTLDEINALNYAQEVKNDASVGYFDKIFGSSRPTQPEQEIRNTLSKGNDNTTTTNSYFDKIFASDKTTWHREKRQTAIPITDQGSHRPMVSESEKAESYFDKIFGATRKRPTKAQLRDEARQENRIRRQKERLRRDELERIKQRRREREKRMQLKQEERAQILARVEAKRHEKLEEKLRKRVLKLEKYLENTRFQKRLDRDAISKELDDWKLELSKPREERISLDEFKEKLQRKLKPQSCDKLQNDPTQTGEQQEAEDGEKEVPVENYFLRKSERERDDKVEEKRLKRLAQEVVEKRRKRIATLERTFSNFKTKYRPEVPQLWEELYKLKQQEQQRLIEEFEKGVVDDTIQLLILPVFSPLHQEMLNRETHKMQREIGRIERELAKPRAKCDVSALNLRLNQLKDECEKRLGAHYGAQLEREATGASPEEYMLDNETSDSNRSFNGQEEINNDELDDYRLLTDSRPFRLPNENYIKFYNRFVSETLDPTKSIPESPLSSLNVNYDGTYPNEPKYPGSFWSAEEKELFFTLLARYSIHQLDMISLHLGKSELEIVTYYNLLKLELNKLKKRARHSGQSVLKEWDSRLVRYEEIPAAYEMLKYFTKLEDEQSLLINVDGDDKNEVADHDESDALLLNKVHLSRMFSRPCDDETCQIMEDLVKQVTRNILINIVNAKTKNRPEDDLGDASTISIFPKNIKSSLTQLGYSQPNAIFNCDNPFVKKVYTEKYGQHRWFSNLQNLVSVPAFGELTPVQRKPTIRTIHNLHQFQEHTNAVEDAVDEDFESKLFQLETETVDDHDILELRMYEHALLLMLLEGRTDACAGDLKRLKRWDREYDLEEKLTKSESEMDQVINGELGDDESDSDSDSSSDSESDSDSDSSSDESDDDYDLTDALEDYSRQFPNYDEIDGQTLVKRRKLDETHFEIRPTASDVPDDDNDGEYSIQDHDKHDNHDENNNENHNDDENEDEGALFDEFFIRHYH